MHISSGDGRRWRTREGRPTVPAGSATDDGLVEMQGCRVNACQGSPDVFFPSIPQGPAGLKGGEGPQGPPGPVVSTLLPDLLWFLSSLYWIFFMTFICDLCY